MKVSATLAGTFFGLLGGVSVAQDAWLLRHLDQHYVVQRALGNVVQDIATVGDQPTYGASPDVLVILSRKPGQSGFVADVIEKETRQVINSWPISGHPMTQLSGPTDDVVLSRDFAYFVTFDDLDTSSHDAHEGWFELNRLRLSDGSTQKFAIPKDCAAPRLVLFGDDVLVYAWNGYGVLRFDTRKAVLKGVLGREDMGDILAGELLAQQAGKLRLGAFADYVVVPNAGVFRLSRMGELQQVLDASLTMTPRPRRKVVLGAPGSILRVFAGIFDGRAAIGAIRKAASGGTELVSVDPATLTVEPQGVLPNSALTTSVLPSASDGVLFMDQASASIGSVAKKKAGTLLKLLPGVDPADTTILLLEHAN